VSADNRTSEEIWSDSGREQGYADGYSAAVADVVTFIRTLRIENSDGFPAVNSGFVQNRIAQLLESGSWKAEAKT
jgi:hypothetical protein